MECGNILRDDGQDIKADCFFLIYMAEGEDLVKNAEKVFLENFDLDTWFERAIFFSWHCSIRTCSYCYMSTQPEEPQKRAVRSHESILAELILCRLLGWMPGFVSGGIGAFREEEFLQLLQKMHLVNQDKLWLNIGALTFSQMQKFAPYAHGVVGSIETVNPVIHKKVCPDKPAEPYFDMFRNSARLKLKNAATIILGLGESSDDFPLLRRMIEEYRIEKIHIYGLNPHENTAFMGASPPSMEYQAEWIAKTRIAFPKIDIQCGIWMDRPEYVGMLLKAGANSVSKFPVIRQFGLSAAKMILSQADLTGRKWKGSLTQLPDIDWKSEAEKLAANVENKSRVVEKVMSYVELMKKNQ